MAISSRYGSEWRDFFFLIIFFFTCTPYVVSLWDGMGWRGMAWDGVGWVGGWVSLNDVLAHSLLFMVSVRPTGPLPASRPAGTAESVVASATQRVKWTLTNNKKKKTKKPVDRFLSFKCWDISYLFVYVTSFLGWLSSFRGKLLLSQKILQKWQLHFYGCTSLVHEQGCRIAEHCCLVPKLQLHHKGHP